MHGYPRATTQQRSTSTSSSFPAMIALSSDDQKVFKHIGAQFHLDQKILVELTRKFIDEFDIGLSKYNEDLAMIPSFVTGVPNGTETGTFLALDLGGTNLRVCEVVLHGDKTFSIRSQKYRVSENLKTGEVTALFDYLADSVDAFLTTNPLTSNSSDTAEAVNLGLTFSFPVEQTALGSGTILTWTKGFAAKDAIGRDVVRLLQDAFDKKHMHVKCVALVNDTVGTLLTRAYIAGGCIAGAIFGTGTNGAYIEHVSRITKLADTPFASSGKEMIVNCEWGAFNNSKSHLPITPYDNAVDRLSINPGFQMFEKSISGMYLGEITRYILLSLIDAVPRPLVFNGKSTAILNEHYGLDTSVMSAIEEAWRADSDKQNSCDYGDPTFDSASFEPEEKTRLERVRTVVVSKLGFKDSEVSLTDAAIVHWACSLVARRAAMLSGVAIAAVLVQTGRASLPDEGGAHVTDSRNETLGVGVDGSLIEYYPDYERTLRESLCAVVGEDVEKRVDIGLAKDGSGVGAALCALQAIKQKHHG